MPKFIDDPILEAYNTILLGINIDSDILDVDILLESFDISKKDKDIIKESVEKIDVIFRYLSELAIPELKQTVDKLPKEIQLSIQKNLNSKIKSSMELL